MLLTPGNFMAEYISISSDRTYLVFAANAGSDADDIDRRHIVKVPVDKAEPVVLTPGKGLEWTPFVTGDGKYIAYLAATAQRPPLPAVMPVAGGGKPVTLAEDRLPSDFRINSSCRRKWSTKHPTDSTSTRSCLKPQVAPRRSRRSFTFMVVHHGRCCSDGTTPTTTQTPTPSTTLASRGYVVLSVNFRLGIGYGHDFHRPPNAGVQGAAEYQDVKAGGEYLQRLPQVDAKRIGIYGGSYGGYLTALALARDSKLFAVDIHGVHNWTAERAAATGESLRKGA